MEYYEKIINEVETALYQLRKGMTDYRTGQKQTPPPHALYEQAFKGLKELAAMLPRTDPLRKRYTSLRASFQLVNEGLTNLAERSLFESSRTLRQQTMPKSKPEGHPELDDLGSEDDYDFD